MKILMIIEHDNQLLKSANFHTLSAIESLDGTKDILIAGYQCDAVVEEAKKMTGIQRIYLADSPEYEHQLAENIAPLIAEIAKEYDVVMTAATTYGKNILPRVAAHCWMLLCFQMSQKLFQRMNLFVLFTQGMLF